MNSESLFFLTIGDNSKKGISKFCLNEDFSEKVFEWVNLNSYFEKLWNVDFKKMSLEEIIEISKKQLGTDIEIFKDRGTGLVNNETISLFLNDSGHFDSLSQQRINHLYSNYVISNKHDAFFIKKDKNDDSLIFELSNSLKKDEIDFYNMSILESDSLLKKYDLYHSTRNRLFIGDNQILKPYLIDRYPNLFFDHDDLRFLNLPFEDFCAFSSIASFIPDFYFTNNGKLNMIYSTDLNRFIKNIKQFIQDINISKSDDIFTFYSYV